MNNTHAKRLNITLNIPQTSWESLPDKNKLIWELAGRYIGPDTDATVAINVTPLKKK